MLFNLRDSSVRKTYFNNEMFSHFRRIFIAKDFLFTFAGLMTQQWK